MSSNRTKKVHKFKTKGGAFSCTPYKSSYETIRKCIQCSSLNYYKIKIMYLLLSRNALYHCQGTLYSVTLF